MYTKRLIILSITLILGACSPRHNPGTGITSDKGGDDNSGNPKGVPVKPPVDDGKIHFQQVVDTIFKTTGCLDCHKKFTNYALVVKGVVPNQPEKSKLYLRAKLDMPPIDDGYPPLTNEQLEFIKQWIAQGSLE
ncbi:MAG: hypothetical protein H6623_04780 [Bdellovibrionaceae bacterium]|nr:hypothetical protein [Pseudobdellovibrionaceae bacterium]